MTELHLSQDPEADRLISSDPLALLIGMVLDQQVPLERAFRSPYDLERRLGRPLDASVIASMDPDTLASAFASPPALHRFPSSMAGRVQELCRHLVEHYGGRAEAVWSTASSGDELLARLRALPGFGAQKAAIFVAFLAKRMGVMPVGWKGAAGGFGEEGVFRSIADIDGPDDLARVRQYKQEMKARSRSGR